MTNEQISYRDAIGLAIADELEVDSSVILLGEDVGAAGGAFKSTLGLFERFGPERVRDTPISEQAIVGAAIGAALMGLRPVAEIMFADFLGVCFDQIANQLGKYRYMTAGQASVPVTIRLANGAGAGFGSQHSQPAENWLLNIPGLKIVVPATVADCYGLIRAAIRDDDPVLVFEHKNLMGLKGVVTSDNYVIGKAELVRRGSHLTVVATQQMRHRAEAAAEYLQNEGIQLELIDPRSLAPFDDDCVSQSLIRTSRLLVIQESPQAGSWGASLIARMVEEFFEYLDAPPRLLAAADTPIPFAKVLEDAWMPDVDRIVASARDLVNF